MIALDAVELHDHEYRRLVASWEILCRMLLLLTQAEHPYAYLVATERRPQARPRA